MPVQMLAGTTFTSDQGTDFSHPSIYDEIGTVDKATLVTGEEENGLRLLDSFAPTTGGEVDLATFALLDIVSKPVLEKRCAVDGVSYPRIGKIGSGPT